MAPQTPTPATPRQNINFRKPPAELTPQDRLDNDDAIDGTAEDEVLDPGERQPARQSQDDDDDRQPRQHERIGMSPQDDMRSKIAARFRRAEPEDERPFNGDMSDPENLYGEFARQDEDEGLTDEEIDAKAEERERQAADGGRKLPPARQPRTDNQEEPDEGDDQPQMITRLIRGKRVTKSLDEWLDAASQVTAADSYLAESREVLAQAKEIRGRPAPDRQHPDDEGGAEDDDLGGDPPEREAQHPEPTFRNVVQKIQFGDAEDAAVELERLVDARADKKANEGQLKRAFDQDLARSQKALAAFSKANPELANDEIAAIAIERGMYSLYKEDMLALGLEESQLPKTPRELANWHRFYRVNGYEVSQTSDLLNKSKDQFLKYLGGKRGTQEREQPSRKPRPEVRINVDRDARRMAIPNQPTRTVTPRRDVRSPERQAGSDIVANMRRMRGQA